MTLYEHMDTKFNEIACGLKRLLDGIKTWFFITLIIMILSSTLLLISPVEFDGKMSVDININLNSPGNTFVQLPRGIVSPYYGDDRIEMGKGANLTIGLNKIDVEGKFKAPMYAVILYKLNN